MQKVVTGKSGKCRESDMCMNMRMCMNMHIRQCEETWTYWLDMRVKMRISDEYALFPENMRGNRGINIHEYV